MAKYLWYSGATDITGKKLAQELGCIGIKTRPQRVVNGDVIIGWGAKTSELVDIENATVFNHPNKIRKNRDKFKTLQILSNNEHLKPCIAEFCTAQDVKVSIQNDIIRLPIIGRTKFHQGGKGFWICLTNGQVDRAISNGAQYFQEYLPIETDDGKVIIIPRDDVIAIIEE